MSAAEHFDVAIAGGGIVGCACALACVQRGLKVALVERDVLGSGATAAGMGHIVVMDDSEAQFALTRYSQELWQRLNLSAAAEYVQTGTLWIAVDREEMDGAEHKQAWYAKRDVPCRLLTASEIAEAEPNLASGMAGGLLVFEDAVVYPPVAALELARRAEQLGARLIVGRSVKVIGDGRMALDDGSELRADRLIHALGAEATALMPELPVRKRKGHLVITDRYPGFVQHQLVELGYLKSAHSTTGDSVAFNLQPRPTGQLLIGSSRQFDAEDSGVDRKILSAMLDRAALYMPALHGLNAIRVWTGFRAATPDKLPLIGPVSSNDTLWLATGHEGLGITTSLGTAELLACAFTGDKPAIAPEPYLPGRFAPATTSSTTTLPTLSRAQSMTREEL
ncbi:MAG TPA: FAD-dependent oxidoreductase [Terracidiphilus sp.]|nr:FAD-dependent oxidoreductase [Terracidiphilus sp.]